MVKIIVTDDSEFMRRINIKALKKGGYTDIVEARSGDEAMKLVKEDQPDLVLLDIVMAEKMSGLDTLKKIKKVSKNIKVIMVTVVDQPKVTEEAKSNGADAFIIKPVNATKLISIVKKVLG